MSHLNCKGICRKRNEAAEEIFAGTGHGLRPNSNRADTVIEVRERSQEDQTETMSYADIDRNWERKYSWKGLAKTRQQHAAGSVRIRIFRSAVAPLISHRCGRKTAASLSPVQSPAALKRPDHSARRRMTQCGGQRRWRARALGEHPPGSWKTCMPDWRRCGFLELVKYSNSSWKI